MSGCEGCMRTIQGSHGEMTVDMCMIIGKCVCHEESTGMETSINTSFDRMQ